MKIAVFYELNHGGARRAANEISKQLKKNNIVDLYYISEKKDSDEVQFYNSIHFCSFKSKKWSGGDWKVRLYKDTIELIKLYFLHKHIAGIINSKNYDAIIVHPSKYTQAPFLLRFVNCVKVYYCQEPLRIVYDPLFSLHPRMTPKSFYELFIRNIRKIIDRSNLSHSEYIVANSIFSQININKAYNIRPDVCYLGVDIKFFIPGMLQRNIDVLFINKQSQAESEIVGKLKNVKFKMIIQSTKSKWISEKELAKQYQRSKIVLCLSRNEPFGLIPLEAGACGCVTIAINEGGYKESIIDGVTGFLVEPDPAKIQKKIEELLKNPKLLDKMSKNARENIVKNWTWEKSAQRIERVLKQARKLS